MSVYDYKIKGSSKCFADVMYSVTEFKRKVFVLPVEIFSRKNNKWVNTSSFIDGRFETFLKFEEWKR